MSLQDLANFVEIIGIFAILFGIGMGIVQLKQNQAQRRDLAILECARSFEDKDFTEAYRLISELPDGVTDERLSELGEAYQTAAMRIGHKFETIGLLVHRGAIPFDAMEDLVGGAALTIWRVLEPWVHEARIKRSHPSFWEWFEWLVQQLQARGRENRAPAVSTYAKWKAPKA
jgi:hypothetical protein